MIKNIALLKGGNSLEAEVSKLSAASVEQALLANGYNVDSVEINNSFIEWAIENKEKVDVFFNALHGTWGEDGKIQGVFEYLQVPYTHSGVLSSAIGMNKYLSKKLFKSEGLPVPDGGILNKDFLETKGKTYQKPFIIKPVSEGSSINVHIVKESKDLDNITKKINSEKLLIEDFIEGVDLTVGVMGGEAIGLLEIETNKSFYDFNAKYKSDKTSYKEPKNLSKGIIKKILEYSEKANNVLNCTGITRVDFRFDESRGIEGIFLLEINTQPGLTKSSLLPKIAENAGISFTNLIDWIVKDARINK